MTPRPPALITRNTRTGALVAYPPFVAPVAVPSAAEVRARVASVQMLLDHEYALRAPGEGASYLAPVIYRDANAVAYVRDVYLRRTAQQPDLATFVLAVAQAGRPDLASQIAIVENGAFATNQSDRLFAVLATKFQVGEFLEELGEIPAGFARQQAIIDRRIMLPMRQTFPLGPVIPYVAPVQPFAVPSPPAPLMSLEIPGTIGPIQPPTVQTAGQPGNIDTRIQAARTFGPLDTRIQAAGPGGSAETRIAAAIVRLDQAIGAVPFTAGPGLPQAVLEAAPALVSTVRQIQPATLAALEEMASAGLGSGVLNRIALERLAVNPTFLRQLPTMSAVAARRAVGTEVARIIASVVGSAFRDWAVRSFSLTVYRQARFAAEVRAIEAGLRPVVPLVSRTSAILTTLDAAGPPVEIAYRLSMFRVAAEYEQRRQGLTEEQDEELLRQLTIQNGGSTAFFDLWVLARNNVLRRLPGWPQPINNGAIGGLAAIGAANASVDVAAPVAAPEAAPAGAASQNLDLLDILAPGAFLSTAANAALPVTPGSELFAEASDGALLGTGLVPMLFASPPLEEGEEVMTLMKGTIDFNGSMGGGSQGGWSESVYSINPNETVQSMMNKMAGLLPFRMRLSVGANNTGCNNPVQPFQLRTEDELLARDAFAIQCLPPGSPPQANAIVTPPGYTTGSDPNASFNQNLDLELGARIKWLSGGPLQNASPMYHGLPVYAFDPATSGGSGIAFLRYTSPNATWLQNLRAMATYLAQQGMGFRNIAGAWNGPNNSFGPFSAPDDWTYDASTETVTLQWYASRLPGGVVIPNPLPSPLPVAPPYFPANVVAQAYPTWPSVGAQCRLQVRQWKSFAVLQGRWPAEVVPPLLTTTAPNQYSPRTGPYGFAIRIKRKIRMPQDVSVPKVSPVAWTPWSPAYVLNGNAVMPGTLTAAQQLLIAQACQFAFVESKKLGRPWGLERGRQRNRPT